MIVSVVVMVIMRVIATVQQVWPGDDHQAAESQENQRLMKHPEMAAAAVGSSRCIINESVDQIRSE